MAGKKKKKKPEPEGIQNIAENRRARHDYAISDTFEAGMVLLGTEVKSLRQRHVNFSSAYAFVKNGEAFVSGLKIEAYDHGGYTNHAPERVRKLLLNQKEINRLIKKTAERGTTLVPLKLYFKKGWCKMLIGIGTGKTGRDQREDVKKRDAQRDIRRVLKRG